MSIISNIPLAERLRPKSLKDFLGQKHLVGENGPIKNYNDIANSETSLFKEFFHSMLKENIYFAPSAFEAGFMSSEHTDREIDSTLSAVEKVFKKISKKTI